APNINVNAVGPTASFTPTPLVGACKNSPVALTSTSVSGPAPAITNSTWTFGDGQTASGPDASHSYTDTGFFHISLQVTDTYGCTDTYVSPDSIQITSPIAKFAGPDSFYCPGVPLHFIDSSQGYNILEAWSYGDGSATDSAVHTYVTAGQIYTAKLTVTDKYSCTATFTKPVTIQKPVATFDIADTTAICVPLQTEFTSHSQYYDSLYWDFGDGSTSTLPVTSHFYNTLDTFVAKLYVQGPGGCLDSASRRVLALDPTAITKFIYSPLYHCDSVAATFSLVVPGYVSFAVAFGDGQYDSTGDTMLSHLYRNPNHYSPSITMTDATGCIFGVGGFSPIYVLGATPFFSPNKHSFCDSSLVTFTDFTISNNGYARETYTFSDGSPEQTEQPGSGVYNVSNYFNKAGAWPVILTVSTDSGCTESYADTIRVYQTPHPAITTASLLCAGLVQFDADLNAPQVDTITWAWNFGNGQTSGAENPTVRMDAGNYTITLKASTSLGCADTTSKQVTVNPLPEIKGPNQLTTPLGIPVTIPFTYSSDVTSYVWSPPTNLDCPTCPNPVATLLLSTQYAVTVTDTNNCKAIDSIFIKTICTTDNIFVPNTFSPNGDGVNDVFYPRGKSLYNVQSLSIFNRWGQMVFQRRDFPANSQDMGWDGNFNGHPAPADAYVYIVEVICENAQVVAIHGSVTLVR
ncbi:gliding motility-associated C-terminal domain-containing protein, partial [Puia sp.]|uniref:gliding motility-associated C-terminal domain-containing protein n=1 Tax=Puia sp. TaxID=2045100 RepID=UPI002F42F92C